MFLEEGTRTVLDLSCRSLVHSESLVPQCDTFCRRCFWTRTSRANFPGIVSYETTGPELNLIKWTYQELRQVTSHLMLTVYQFTFPGNFGQSSPWDIFTPASWSHPRVPHEVLTDPQSMPAHPVLEGGVPATCRREEQDKVAEGKASAEVGPGTHSSPGLAHSSRQIGTSYKLHPERVKA